MVASEEEIKTIENGSVVKIKFKIHLFFLGLPRYYWNWQLGTIGICRKGISIGICRERTYNFVIRMEYGFQEF